MMKIILVYIIYSLIIGGNTLSRNAYRRQLDSDTDGVQSEFVDIGKHDKAIKEKSLTTKNLTDPKQQNSEMQYPTSHFNRKNTSDTKENNPLSSRFLQNFTGDEARVQKENKNTSNDYTIHAPVSFIAENNKTQSTQSNLGKGVEQQNILLGGTSNNCYAKEISRLGDINREKEPSAQRVNSAVKDVHKEDDSKEDFEYQLSKFFGFQRKESSEEETISSDEQTVIYAEISSEIPPNDKNRLKRESAPEMRYVFNVKPLDDINEGESTSTETNNLTPTSTKEIDKLITSEPIDKKEPTPVNNTSANVLTPTSTKEIDKLITSEPIDKKEPTPVNNTSANDLTPTSTKEIDKLITSEPIDKKEPTPVNNTSANDLTSISTKEIDKLITSEPIDKKEPTPVNNTSANDTNANEASSTFMARLTSFLLTFYATIREIATNMYLMISNIFN